MKHLFTLLIALSLGFALQAQTDPCQNFAANFTFEPPGSNLTVEFINQSTGEYTELLWNFGDGGTSDTSNPTHTYASIGTYQICLTIANAWCESSTCKTVLITPIDPPPCEAYFNMESNGLTAFFNGNPSVPNDLSGFMWNFGDGTADDDHFEVSHTYAESGTYTVCLTIWNNATDCEDQYCQTITVTAPTPTCDANFVYETSGLTAYLNGTSSTASGDISSYQWWYNGAIIGDGATLTYTFPEAGEYQVCLVIHTGNGCVSEDCHGVVVSGGTTPTCDANFVYETDGLVAYLNGTSSTASGDISSYQWWYNGAIIGDGATLTYTFPEAGEYQVCLVIHTGNGCVSEDCHGVVVSGGTTPTCDANFVYETSGLTAYLNGTSSTASGDISSYQWWYNGAIIGDGATLTYTFPEAGEYQVCLVVHTGNGCVSEDCHGVVVSGGTTSPCEAYFNMESNGLTAFFNGNPSVPNDLSGFMWNFGDGTADDDHFEVSHTYAESGTYTVCLTIWNNVSGCEDQYCQTITVTAPTPTCDANFVYETSGLTAYLNGTSSTASGDISSYQWWYNGAIIGDGATLTYTFPEAGEYQVCLVVHTGNGCVSEDCHGVVVSGGTTSPCEAYFNMESNGLTAFFNGNPSVPNDLSGFAWNFGDGTADDDHFEVSHTYALSGTYTVCLTIWNNATDCEDQYCQTIIINSPTPTCDANFVYETDGLIAYLNGTSSTASGDISSYQWWYNGAIIGDGATLTYTFPEAGEYQVCLVVHTGNGCVSEDCHGVVVSGGTTSPCEAYFNMESNGLTAFFNGNPSVPNDLSGFAWNFGDGTADDDHFEVSHTYALSGTYTVCLTIWNNVSGCEDQYCQTIIINSPTPTCDANFVYETDGLIAYLNGTSSTASGDISSYQWWYNGAIIGDGATLTYTFPEAGEYQVCLVIHTGNGCVSEDCHGVVVSGGTTPTCDANFVYETDGLIAYLNGTSSTASGDISSYQWWYNGAIIGDGATLTYTFPEAGEYQVCLVIHTGNGCVSEDCHGVVVSGGTTPTCDANFVYETDGLVAYLNGTTSTASGDISSYQWWYNGAIIGDGATLTYTFPEAGEYQVCLVIHTGNGCVSEDCHGVVVSGGADPCPALWVNFTYEWTSTPLSVHFIKFTEGAGSGAQLLWNFGDGGTSTTANPTHTYSVAGTYVVCLSVTTAAGCTEQYCENIIISSAEGVCAAAITYTLNGNIGTFSASGSESSGNIVAYSWWRGSALVGINETATINFATSGTYDICLTITTDNGCTDEVCQSVVVTLEAPMANGLSVNPNLLNAQMNIDVAITLQTAQQVTISLLDITGQQMRQQSVPMEVGTNSHTLSGTNLLPGMYVLRATLANGTVMMRKVLVVD
jgi:PKD repeat protein